MKNWKIIAIAYGFYFFGREIPSETEGYIAITEAAMFGGFTGGKGLPGIATGASGTSVTLDPFAPAETLFFPNNNVIAIMPSINLYSFKGTKIRK